MQALETKKLPKKLLMIEWGLNHDFIHVFVKEFVF